MSSSSRRSMLCEESRAMLGETADSEWEDELQDHPWWEQLRLPLPRRSAGPGVRTTGHTRRTLPGIPVVAAASLLLAGTLVVVSLRVFDPSQRHSASSRSIEPSFLRPSPGLNEGGQGGVGNEAVQPQRKFEKRHDKGETDNRTHFLDNKTKAQQKLNQAAALKAAHAAEENNSKLESRADELLQESNRVRANASSEQESLPPVTNDNVHSPILVANDDSKWAEVDELLQKAQRLRESAASNRKESRSSLERAVQGAKAAQTKVNSSVKLIPAAMQNITEARKEMDTAKKAMTTAEAVEKASRANFTKGHQDVNAGQAQIETGKADLAKAKAEEANIQKEQNMVGTLSDKAFQITRAHRTCSEIPRAQLRAIGEPRNFDSWLIPKDVATAAECHKWCLNEEECVQSVFVGKNGSSACELYDHATAEVLKWNSEASSAFCADSKQETLLQDLAQQVWDQQPELPEVVQCSWAGEDCSETRCCNDVSCNWAYTDCSGYTCYQEVSDGFGDGNSLPAMCKQSEPWNMGPVLGVGRPATTIAPSDEKTVQGTSLFCFMVVNWNSTERDLVNNAKDKHIGIYQCDGHMIYDAQKTPKSAWGTYMNAAAFAPIWQQLYKDGAYKDFDWTVKVDADAVFFPSILRMHLGVLRVQQGTQVYIKNINFRFQFLGALEVMTKEALDKYSKDGMPATKKLLRAHPKAGEDFLFRASLDAIGIASAEDFELLRDASCGELCPGSDGPCNNGQIAAFHPYPDVDAWNTCYNEAEGLQIDLLPTRQAPIEVQITGPESGSSQSSSSSSSSEAEEVKSLLAEAQKLDARVRPDLAKAKADAKAAQKVIAAGNAQVERGHSLIQAARESGTKAEDKVHDAMQKTAEAHNLEVSSQRIADKAREQQEHAEATLNRSRSEIRHAKLQLQKADEDEAKAESLEKEARETTEKLRVCISIEGVLLHHSGEARQDVGSSSEACERLCLLQRGCQESIFHSGENHCRFYETRSDVPELFHSFYNSSLCGMREDLSELQKSKDLILSRKDFLQGRHTCSWMGENCMTSKCCVSADNEYPKPSCFKKNESYAGCVVSPPSGWSGELIRGNQQVLQLQPVPASEPASETMGTSLFCFSIVAWDSPRTSELAQHLRRVRQGLFQCEEHALVAASALPGSQESSSWKAVYTSLLAWDQVKKDGRYLKHDWTIKVDLEQVFLPERLQQHLRSLRAPAGVSVVLQSGQPNNSLQVLSRQAVQALVDGKDRCMLHVDHEKGEEYFADLCLRGLGVNYMVDSTMVASGSCQGSKTVAVGHFESIDAWDRCYDDLTGSAPSSHVLLKRKA